jgi:RimJ/RimL family protein N-acetyltransferase
VKTIGLVGGMSGESGAMTRGGCPVVRLETARLLLDGHGVEDFEPLAAMWADPQVAKYIGGRPSTAQESWLRLLRYGGLWPLLGYGYWAVREKLSGRYIGDLGFADFHRECEPSISGVPEAGWAIATWAQGRGYAREALGAAVAWLDAERQFERSCCLIAPANTVSVHLAERQGFVNTAGIQFKGEATLLFYRPKKSTT